MATEVGHNKNMKKLQSIIKNLPEWVVLLYVFLSLSVIPLIIFNTKWQQLGNLKAAAISCGPLFIALGIIGALITWLYYEDELDN